MAMKTVQVAVKQGAGFRTECTAGKHTVIVDQPTAFGGTDAGPTPLDYQLVALGGCIAAIGRIVAGQQRLAIRGFEISLEAEMDTDGLMGKSSDKRAGFSSITARVKIDGDLTPGEKEKFLQEVERRCPVSDNLQNATPVGVTLAG